MTHPVSIEQRGDVTVMHIDNPPVNALSAEVIDGIGAAFEAFENEPNSRALLVYCSGRTFVAGADISIFDAADFTSQVLNRALQKMEDSRRLVVAVLQGTALGGGFELALACHYRVAVPGTRVGLPEVKLGILPGSLGTQRLPRIAGPVFALEAIQTGRLISAEEALKAGAIDRIAEGPPLEAGLKYVEELLANGAPARRSSAQVFAALPPASFFDDARQRADAVKDIYPAQLAIVEAVEAAATRPFKDGEKVEFDLLMNLVSTPQSAALRHLFFAERAAGKIPALAKDTALRKISSVGVIGAGTMGGGIAMTLANAGLMVVLVDTRKEGLDKGLDNIRITYEASVAKGRMTAQALKQRMALIVGALELKAVADCDLVVEAVFENLKIKKVVCSELGRVCKPGAIIASNTSTLDVDVLAEASGRAEDVVGLHFFSPAHVMRLLEVERGARTAPDVLATAMQLARTINKVAVVSGVCYGFIGNRMAETYVREAEFLLMEGATAAQIDAAAENDKLLGMAMGPCRMLDMAGIDVGAKTLIERRKEGKLSADPAYRAVVQRFNEMGRHGQKTGVGYYRYDGRKALPDPEAESITEAIAAEKGITRRSGISDEEIVERLLYPMINEGLNVLDEGIAYRAGDIDVVWTAGYGFPDHRGGPMFMADRIGARRILERLEHYASERGDAFGYWKPSPLLRRHAEDGTRITPFRVGT